MKRTDEMIVKELRAKLRELATLSKEARDRGIRVSIWDKGSKCLDVLGELDVIAEKLLSL